MTNLEAFALMRNNYQALLSGGTATQQNVDDFNEAISTLNAETAVNPGPGGIDPVEIPD